jgi:hypothetical protein
MFKKELRDIILPALARMSILLVSLVPFFFKDMRDYLGLSGLFILVSVNFFLVILWISGNFGGKAFQREFKDHAFEYMLAFPVSRYRIFWDKLLPRLLVLVVLLAGHNLLFHHLISIGRSSGEISGINAETVILSTFFPVWILFFLLQGFFLSLFERIYARIGVKFFSFLAMISISISIRRLMDVSWFSHQIYHEATAMALGCLLVVVIMGVSFFTVYKTFDLRSMLFYEKRFMIRSVPPLVVLTAVSLVFVLGRLF